MAHPNPLNVYKGPNSMRKYFDPDFQPPLPLIELPAKLNPFRDDNVRIYAKMLTLLPAQNVKALPALNMLLNNPSAAKKSIVEASSGSTVTSLGMSARVLYDNNDTRAYLTNKTELNRLRQLQFWGLQVELYGGPAQPEISDPRGIIEKLKRLQRENENICNPGQYDNENNWTSHIKWTGPQIWKQLSEINVFCMGMGSAGCVSGTGMYLKSHKPSVTVVGVCNAVGDPVPGPRPFPLFESCKFPWRETVDEIEHVSSVDSYRLSMRLSRAGLISGPSSGMALKGLFDFLQRTKNAGKLSEYAEPDTGEISCVFICCDLPHQYLDGYFQKLGDEDFHPITNRELLSFDTDIYVLEWEISFHEAMNRLCGKNQTTHRKPLCSNPACRNDMAGNPFAASDMALVDLRSTQDFDHSHICGSISTPLDGLTAASGPPFDNVPVLYERWKAMKAKFAGGELPRGLEGISGPMIVLCYDGETSRLATAVMRAEGMEAYSIEGGMDLVLKD